METFVTAELAFGAGEVRQLLGLAKRRAWMRALINRAMGRGAAAENGRVGLVKDSSVYLACSSSGPRAYARDCNPQRDRFALEMFEILFCGPCCRTSIDVNAVEACARPDARRVVVQLTRPTLYAPRALLAFRVEPEPGKG